MAVKFKCPGHKIDKTTASQQNALLSLNGSLSNRAIFNDLERPQIQMSRSGQSLTLNISKMAKDTAIVTMEGE